MSRHVTTKEAAEELDIPADLISQWKHRRRITPVGHIRGTSRTGEQPLYDLDELRPLAESWKGRTKKSLASPTSQPGK